MWLFFVNGDQIENYVAMSSTEPGLKTLNIVLLYYPIVDFFPDNVGSFPFPIGGLRG